MPDQKLILITGRSTKQGTGISNGKSLEEYRLATSVIELNQADMDRFGLQDGDSVRLKTAFGQAVVHCRPEEIPEGLAFLAFGPNTSQLIGGETHASGMPDSKGFEVELERIPG